MKTTAASIGSSPVSVVSLSEPAGSRIEKLSLESDFAASKSSSEKEDKQEPWVCRASEKSLRTRNPIRAIVDPIVANIKSGKERGDGKDLISLALGDPTSAGHLQPCPIAIEAVTSALSSKGHAAGYVNACGLPEARQAIAEHHSCNSTFSSITAENVIIANGCSGALEIALTALLDPGTILLVPCPGFSLYQVIAESHGASVAHYKLLPEKNWEIDLNHMEELLVQHGSAVRGILVNNPSNPTGSVFSRAHMESLVLFARRHRLPIVSDEIYGDLTFGHEFHPLADVAASLGREVPVITASGIGKQFLLPGWRVGWIVFQDNIYNSLRPVEDGAKRLAQVILGASHLPQTAVSKLLDPKNLSIHKWKSELNESLERQAKFLCNKLRECPGLQVLDPQGAMYAIVRIPDYSVFDASIQSDLDLVELLLKEENLLVLPGTCFGFPGLFRVVFCAPEEVLEEAANRIKAFCKRHIL